MPVVQKWQVVATLAEFGDFDTSSGGAIELQHTDYIPAGQREPIKLSGTSQVSDITLGRAFDPVRDAAIKDWVNRYKNGRETTRALTLKYLNSQGQVIKTDQYPRVLPKSYAPPDGAHGDNGVAEVKLVLGVEAVV